MKGIKKVLYVDIIPLIGRIFHKRNKYVNVIYYHDIVKNNNEGETYMRTPYSLFKGQMEYIKAQGYETLRFDDLTNEICRKKSKKGILICFDDGWKSNYEMIFDLMKSLGLKCNIFLTAGKIGIDKDYLTWENVKTMHKSGLVGFGAHTYTHPNLSDLYNKDMKHEINDTNALIAQHLDVDVHDFCFPFGAHSKTTIDYFIENHPYDRIYTSNMDYSREANEVIIFGRNGINCAEPMSVFRNKLKGNYNVFSSLGRFLKH